MYIKRLQRQLKDIDKRISYDNEYFNLRLFEGDYDSALEHYRDMKIWNGIRAELIEELNTLVIDKMYEDKDKASSDNVDGDSNTTKG